MPALHIQIAADIDLNRAVDCYAVAGHARDRVAVAETLDDVNRAWLNDQFVAAADYRLVTDAPLDAKNLADEFARGELVKAGKLHAVEIVISAKKQPISVSIYHNAFKYPCSGGSTEDAFEPELFTAKAVAGRAYRKSPGESFDDIVFTYDARFHASIN